MKKLWDVHGLSNSRKCYVSKWCKLCSAAKKISTNVRQHSIRKNVSHHHHQHQHHRKCNTTKENKLLREWIEWICRLRHRKIHKWNDVETSPKRYYEKGESFNDFFLQALKWMREREKLCHNPINTTLFSCSYSEQISWHRFAWL